MYERALGHQFISPCLDAGVLDIFGELGEDELFVVGRRRKRFYLLDAVIGFFRRGVYRVDADASQLLPYLIKRLGKILPDEFFVFLGELERGADALLGQKFGRLRADAPDFINSQLA